MVQKLKQTGATPQAIREATGVSERTQRRIEQEAPVEDTDDERFRKSRKVGRPSTAQRYEGLVQQWLEEPRRPQDGPLKSIEVFTRLQALGYEGGKTAVYDLVQRLRPPESKSPLVRFEGLPGEFSQHDFGQRKVSFADGTSQTIHFFASRLKYSRTIDVQVVPNEQLETVVRCLLRAFERFGGMPLQCVFDNMSSVVDSRETRAEGQVKVNWSGRWPGESSSGTLPYQRFGQFVIECGFIPVACWPYRPQQKGSVENLVGFVKGNFFRGRCFQDLEDLKGQLESWVQQVNSERICAATGEIPAVRLQQEPLKPCPHQAETYPFKATAVVRPTARVAYQGIEYSLPSQFIGQQVTLHLQAQRVALYLGNQLLAVHPRFPENGKSSVLAEHAEELFRWQRGKPYAQRQLLLDLDPVVEPYLTEVVHRRPQGWERDVDLMYQLYRQIGRTELLAAVELAIEQRCFGGEYLMAIADEVLTTSRGRRS